MKDQRLLLTPSQKKRVDHYKENAEIIEIRRAPAGRISPFDRTIRVLMRSNLKVAKYKNQMVEIGVRGGFISKTKYDEDWNVMYWIDNQGILHK